MRRPNEASLSEFRIFETEEFTKRLKKLSSREASFLTRKLRSFVYPQLKAEPFWGNNIKKLQGYSPETWRYRIGKFRVFYIVAQEEQIIYVLTVDYRRDAYRSW
jgi:mRNA interferase RelE/StbE